MKLYVGAESGNSWKLRIFLDQLAVAYEKVPVDLLAWEHKKKDFIAGLNPRGQVPVLEDDGCIIWDSGACLVYLARKYDRRDWLPVEPGPMAEVLQWVFMAETEIQFGLQYGRRGVMRDRWIIGTWENRAQYQAIGRMALDAMESRLAGHDWLAGEHISIADIACFPYVFYSSEAGLPLDNYPGVRSWIARCRAIPNWSPAPQPPTRHYPDNPVDHSGRDRA
jgi:glutathione S-transferase